jgi:hypothetical protein
MMACISRTRAPAAAKSGCMLGISCWSIRVASVREAVRMRRASAVSRSTDSRRRPRLAGKSDRLACAASLLSAPGTTRSMSVNACRIAMPGSSAAMLRRVTSSLGPRTASVARAMEASVPTAATESSAVRRSTSTVLWRSRAMDKCA